VAILDSLGAPCASVFASCGGAAIGLDLVARFPHYVNAMVVHEPLLVHVLPDADEQIAIIEGFRETNRRAGPTAAMLQWMQFVGHDYEVVVSETLRERAERDGDFVLRHEVMPMITFQPDYAAVSRSGVPIALAAGDGSLADGYGYARAAPILADVLACPMVIFPGHHTSYTYRADDFAAALTSTLRNLSSPPSEEGKLAPGTGTSGSMRR
jgi:hypothetical protein